MDILTLLLAIKLGGGSSGLGGLTATGKEEQILVMGQNGLEWRDRAAQEDMAGIMADLALLPSLTDENGSVLVNEEYQILTE